MRIGFRFKLVPFIATVLLVALGIALGNWQERRAAEKIALEHKLALGNAAAPFVLGAAPLDPAANLYRRVAVTGEFVRGWPLYLENRPYQDRVGFYLLMPFKIAGTDMHVLVARGWLPRNSVQREQLPPYQTPQGTVTIVGTVKLNAGHVMQLGSAPPLTPGAIVQNADVAQVAAASGLQLQPFVLEQSTPPVPGAAATLMPAGAAADGDDGLLREWPAPALGVERNRGYAFQWYGLALMAFLFFVLNGYRRGKDRAN